MKLTKSLQLRVLITLRPVFEITTTAMKKKVQIDEVPLLELMPEHCLKIAALIFYCALDCLIKKSVRIRKSSIGLVQVSLHCYRKARTSSFRGWHVTAKHSN